jgi:hypothetical protein|tara:strand:+ start:9315 stop:9893 length:579 start_codon:yes stop_codon:yes gene_type:complete
MKPKIIKNFADKIEVGILNWWTIDNYRKNSYQYKDAKMDPDHPGSRFTTRIGPDEKYSSLNIEIAYPKVAYIIQERILWRLKLKHFKFPPPFYNGIVNGIGVKEGLICEHIDPVYYPNTVTMHCNIITRKADSGGITIIDGIEYDIEPGDLLVYPVSELLHRVTLTKGTTNRILWVFGFCLPKDKAEDVFQC